MPAQVATSVATKVHDLEALGFPEPSCTLQVAAELLLFKSDRALEQWLRRRRDLFPPRYLATGRQWYRVLTRSECWRIYHARTLDRLPGRRGHHEPTVKASA